MKTRSFYFLAVIIGVLFSFNTYSQNFWEQVNTQIATYSFGMTNDGAIYAKDGNFLYRSTDDGATGSWNQVSGFPTVNSYSIFTSGNTIFLTNYHGVDHDGRGIFVSNDSGSTWVQKNDGLDGDTNVRSIFQLGGGVLLADAEIDPFTNDLYRSTDGGDSWNFVQSIDNSVRMVAVASPSESYISAGNNVYRSTDNGQSWTDMNASLPSNELRDIVVAGNGDLLASASHELLESTDNGSTWTSKTTNGLPSIGSDLIMAFKKLHGDTIYLTIENDKGVFYSADHGTNWTEITDNINSTQISWGRLDVSIGGYLFASPSNSGIYRSSERVTDNTVGLDSPDDRDGEFQVQPNPTRGELQIVLGETEGTTRVTIRDLTGRVVSSHSVENASNFRTKIEGEAGLYLVELRTEGGRKTVRKVVKEQR